MTPFQSEELENIARQARKIKRNMECYFNNDCIWDTRGVLDCSINILDQVERIKNDNKTKDSTAGH